MGHKSLRLWVWVVLCYLLLWPASAVSRAQGGDALALAAKDGLLTSLPPEARRKIDPLLLKALAGDVVTDVQVLTDAERHVSFLVWMREEAALGEPARIAALLPRRQAIVAALQETASRSQQGVRATLQQEAFAGHVTSFEPYWIVNALAVQGDAHAILALAARADVAAIRYDRTHHLPPQMQTQPALLQDGVVPWNIKRIGAELVWGGFGITGAGIVVANMDTGVAYQHPALLRQYRGYEGDRTDHNYNWFDATGTSPMVPADGNGHGTHTMGTIVGVEPDGSHAIGVAPGARWIAVKVFTDDGQSTDSAILRGFQWIMAPTDLRGARPDPSKAPDIVSNSWGSEISSDTTFLQAVRAWRVAGILPVFAAGNEGPEPGTVGSPASFAESLAVGAVDIADQIANFSSRGPSPWGEIKPEVVAPGVDIYSAVPNGGYERGWNGTSMATPHVAGLAALLWEADRTYNRALGLKGAGVNPTLSITATEQLIMQTAHDLGDAGPDNSYGWGRIDAYQAVGAVIPHGRFRGCVVDQATGQPIAGALVTLVSLERSGMVTAVTDANGDYSLAVATGLYDATASHFRYQAQTVAQIRVLRDTATQLDFALTAQPAGTLRGRVTSASSRQPLPAVVEVLNTPITATTDAQGVYVLPLPVGTYDVRVLSSATGYRGALMEGIAITLGADVQRDLALADAPTILLVHGDAWRQERPARYYENALKDNLYAFDTWDIVDTPDANPTADDLLPYDIIIWSHPKTSPGYIGAWAALAAYIDGGGHLLLTGQDIGYWDSERGYGTAYYRDYLHSRYIRDDVDIAQLSGTAGGIFAGISFSLNTEDSAQNQRYPSEIAPLDGLALPLAYYAGDGYGALQIDRCDSRIVYLAFGLEGIGPEAMRQEVMRRSLEWLGAARPEYAAQIVPPQQTGTGVMGSTVVYTATIANTGQLTETFSLVAQERLWRVALVSPETGDALSAVSLAPCDSATIAMHVTIPITAAVCDSDVVTVTAVSQHDPTRRAQSVLRTTAFPNWQEESPLPVPRSRAGVTAVGSRVYVVGGEGAGGYLNLVDVYDPTARQWRSGYPKPTRASNLAIAAIGEKVYAPGGYNDNTLAILEVYDTTTDSWISKAGMPAPRLGHVTVAVGSRLYVIGGSDGAEVVNTTWEYNLATDQWTAKADMPHPRAFAAAAVVDGVIYVIGGRDNTTDDLPYVEAYDPQADRWTTKRNLTVPRMGAAAATIEGYLYLVGGGATSYLSLVERYDPYTDAWQTLPSLNHPRRTLGLAAVCGGLYAISGWDGDYRGYNETFHISSSLINSRFGVSAELAQPGDVLTYTLTLLNLGGIDLDATVLVPIATRTTYLPGSATGGLVFEAASNSVQWMGAIPAHATRSLTFRVQVASDVSAGDVISTTAWVDDGVCGPYAFRASTTIALPDLFRSTKIVSREMATSGDVLTYTITLRNASLVRATGIQVADPLPATLTYIAESATAGAVYDAASHQLRWQGTVPAGRTATASYEWADSDTGDVTFDWIDTSGGTSVPGGDDVALGPFPLGFTFRFFGNDYSEFYINTNGQVLFGQGSSQYARVAIPNPAPPNNFIAPLWGDLVCGANTLTYQTFGVAPQRYTVIEWREASRFRSMDRYTFEVVLFEGSNEILLQYLSMTGEHAGGDSMAIGIENLTGTDGVQYLLNGAPADRQTHDGLAIRFRPTPPTVPGEQLIQFRARVADALPINSRIVNTAWITDSLQHTLVLTSSLPVNVVDLSRSAKRVDKAWALAGDTLHYTVHLRHDGSVAAHTIWTDTLPTAITYLPDTFIGLAGATYDPTTRQIVWQGDILPQSDLIFGFAAQVSAAWGSGEMITNTVEIAAAGEMLTRHAATIVATADLSDSRKVVDKVSAVSGDVLTYEVAVVNSAPVPAGDVQVWDPLPEHTAYVPGSATGGAIYDPEHNAISWTGPISAAVWAQTTYIWADSRTNADVVFDWVEIAEVGIDLGLADDDYVYLELPFAVSFYDATYSHLAIGSNGTLHFADTYLGRDNTCLPGSNSYGVAALIAVFWDELNPFAAGHVYYAVLGDAPQRRFIVSWDGVASATGDPVSFQAILHEGSRDIVLQYRDVMTGNALYDQGSSATIGIQADEHTGTLYACAQPLLTNELAIRFVAVPQPSEKVISFQVTVDDGLPLNTALVNRAVIGYQSAISYTRTVTTFVNLVDLSPSRKEVWPASAGAGDVLTYTITLQNQESQPAPHVRLMDALPTSTLYITDSVTGGATYDDAQRQIVWEGSIPGTQPAIPGSWADSDDGRITFAWRDATGGVALPGGDDVALGPFPIGFSFHFFGRDYNEFYINSNGQVLFGAGSSRYSNVCIPNPNEPNNFIAAFWDDLIIPTTGGLYYQTMGEAPHRYLVVQWHQVRRIGSQDLLTFQVVLFEGQDDILLQYLTMPGTSGSGSGATVGIENAEGGDGLQYLCDGAPAANAIHDNLAVRLTPPRPETLGIHQVSFQVRVAADTPLQHSITNRAVISDGVQSTFTRTVTVTANTVDLSPSRKDVDHKVVAAGEVLHYTITLHNRGSGTAPGVVVHDPLPMGATYVAGSATAGAVYEPERHRVVWQGSVSPGIEQTIAFAARTDPLAANGSVITNTVWISDGVSAPLARTARTTLRSADLSPSAKEVSAASALPGETITYTILVRNVADVATSARVTDVLPAGLAYVPDTLFASSGVAGEQDGVITWQGIVREQSMVIIRFAAQVEEDVASGSLIVNEALIRGGAGVVFSRSAPLAISGAGRQLHLPLVMKSAG